MFLVPEQYRDLNYSNASDGNNGVFRIPAINRLSDDLNVIASDGLGWEHVSVSKQNEIPSWTEMCRVKEMFWGAEDWVMQFHPAKSDYINNHPYCLHLWRPTEVSFPVPHPNLVGFKK